jgi:hypothetical protein
MRWGEGLSERDNQGASCTNLSLILRHVDFGDDGFLFISFGIEFTRVAK